jgi:RNA polymerase sigma factor (sigma-70 family)
VLLRTYLSYVRKHSNKETPWRRLPERAADDEDQALRVTLLNGLARLPAQDRAVLVLRYWEDLSVEDVACALRLSGGAVRNRSMRALGRLREALGEGFEELIR